MDKIAMNGSYNSSSNSTNVQEPFQPPPWYSNAYNFAMVLLYTLIIIGTILGNILVCTAVAINPNLRKNISVYFVVSLALSDICTACFSMPFDLETYITYGDWHHSEALCSIWTTVYLITVPTSMWTLFALSITRYNMLKSPWDRFKDSPLLTPKRAITVIVSLWVFCLAIALIPIMGVKYIENPLMYGYCIFNISPIYSNIVSFLSFYFPMFAMCFIYYKIYVIARTQYVIPTGLKTKPNVSAADLEPTEMPPRSCSVEHREEKQQNDSKTSSKTSLDTAVGYTRSVDNGGLELDHKNGENTGTIRKAPFEVMENICTDSKDSGYYSWKKNEAKDGKMLEKTSKDLDNWHEEQEHKSNQAQVSVGRHSCASFHHNTCTNPLCDVEVDYDCYLTDKTNSKLRNTPNRSLSLSRANDDVTVPDTARGGNEQYLEERTPELPIVVVAPSTSGTSRCESHQITVRSLSECECSERSNNISALIIPCSSDSRCQSKLDDRNNEANAQEGHNRLGAASENSLSASKMDLNDSTRKRKIFVKNKKAARTIAIIVSAFLLCWIPFTTHSVILNFCSSQCASDANYKASQILLVFGYLNSVMNPIIFSYKDEQFLKSYRKIMKIVFFCSRY